MAFFSDERAEFINFEFLNDAIAPTSFNKMYNDKNLVKFEKAKMNNRFYPMGFDGIRNIGYQNFFSDFELIFDQRKLTEYFKYTINQYLVIIQSHNNFEEKYFVIAYSKLIPILSNLKFLNYQRKILRENEIDYVLRNEIEKVDRLNLEKSYLELSRKSFSYNFTTDNVRKELKNLYFKLNKIKESKFSHLRRKILYQGYLSDDLLLYAKENDSTLEYFNFNLTGLNLYKNIELPSKLKDSFNNFFEFCLNELNDQKLEEIKTLLITELEKSWNVYMKLKQILNCRDELLLCNALGNTSYRINAAAWKSCGGKVYGFTHGHPQYISANPYPIYFDGLLLSDKFFVESSREIENYKNLMPIQNQVTYQVMSEKKLINKNKNNFISNEKFLVMGYPYGCPSGAIAYMNDFSILQIESYIMQLILCNNLNFKYKVHPDRVTEAKSIFKNFLQFFEYRKFEELINLYKTIIISYPYSTTFKLALDSESNIVFLNHQENIFDEYSKKYIYERCFVIDVLTDQENRIQFDKIQFANLLNRLK